MRNGPNMTRLKAGQLHLHVREHLVWSARWNIGKIQQLSFINRSQSEGTCGLQLVIPKTNQVPGITPSWEHTPHRIIYTQWSHTMHTHASTHDPNQLHNTHRKPPVSTDTQCSSSCFPGFLYSLSIYKWNWLVNLNFLLLALQFLNYLYKNPSHLPFAQA